jgi:protein-tyrosine kinase
MSLIQRAMQRGGVAVLAPTPAPPRPEPISTAPQRAVTFRPDFRRLAAEGLITPTTIDGRLGLEISSIKRRLLRRMNFLQRREGDHERTSLENVVIVTSSLPHEGKTFTAANLALSLVLEEQIEAVLIDADFTRPRVPALLGLVEKRGLLDRIKEPALDLDSLLQRAEGLPLSVITAGSTRMSAAEIFSGGAMLKLIEEIAERYSDRFVIIDGPPLLATTEAAALAQHVDQIVMVIEAGRASREDIASALELLASDAKVSLVLNRSFAVGGQSGYYGYYAAGRDRPAGAAGEAAA